MLTECTEDDRSTSKLLSGPHGGHDQLILRISPKTAQGNRFAVSRDHRHHPVTNHLAVMIRLFYILRSSPRVRRSHGDIRKCKPLLGTGNSYPRSAFHPE